MTTERTTLERIIDVISKIGTILIPIILFYFGDQYKKTQDKINTEQQNLNRVTNLLKSLSSSSELERKLAITFSKSLAEAGNFPKDVYYALAKVSSTDSANSKDALDVLNIINHKAIEKNDTVIEKKIKEVSKSSPTVIYMQIPKGVNTDNAKKIFSMLKSNGYNVMGIERMDLNKMPVKNEVRYFLESDQVEAEELSKWLNNYGIKTNTIHVQGYETKNIGSQIEIWLI